MPRVGNHTKVPKPEARGGAWHHSMQGLGAFRALWGMFRGGNIRSRPPPDAAASGGLEEFFVRALACMSVCVRVAGDAAPSAEARGIAWLRKRLA